MGDQPAVLERVAAALDRDVTNWVRPECGLTAAERWVTRFADGTSVFVKAATDPDTAGWLRNERAALAVAGGRFGPALVDWLDDGEFPILITEDLSSAYWPAGTGVVHWRPGDMDTVVAGLAELRSQPGTGLSSLPVTPGRWPEILRDGMLTRAGWCSSSWIQAHEPALLAADRMPASTTPGLVHGDVRSDNLCIGADGRVRFVDWSQAGIGNPWLDLVDLLPTLRLEGGRAPAEVLTDPADLITYRAGAAVARALGDREAGPEWLLDVLRRLAAISLAWVCEVLALASPDGVAFPSID